MQAGVQLFDRGDIHADNAAGRSQTLQSAKVRREPGDVRGVGEGFARRGHLDPAPEKEAPQEIRERDAGAVGAGEHGRLFGRRHPYVQRARPDCLGRQLGPATLALVIRHRSTRRLSRRRLRRGVAACGNIPCSPLSLPCDAGVQRR